MATSKEYMEFTAEQLSEAGTITYRKMFGEYGVYCNGIFFGTVEDNQLYIKITTGGKNFIPNAVIASPHEGANFFLIENIAWLVPKKYSTHNMRGTSSSQK